MTAIQRVFSGVQPTGNLHLGNYLGAIVNFVALQKTHQCIYCVVDLHAITVWQDPAELTRNTREVTAAFIAAGIDPRQQIIFNQSQVAEHAELAWLKNVRFEQVEVLLFDGVGTLARDDEHRFLGDEVAVKRK